MSVGLLGTYGFAIDLGANTVSELGANSGSKRTTTVAVYHPSLHAPSRVDVEHSFLRLLRFRRLLEASVAGPK